MEQDSKGRIFMGILIVASVFILITGPLLNPQNMTSGMVELFGALLILWAFVTIRVTKQKHRDIPQGYFFITHGPYEIIRHPVYAGIILIAASLVEYNFVFLRVVALLLVFLMLLLKIIREEFIMEKKIPEYKEYKKNTKQLIPYLF